MATESGKADTLERRREEKRGEEVYGIDNGGGVGRGRQIYSFFEATIWTERGADVLQSQL